MKYSFCINQAGVIRAGLLGRVNLPALALLDYIQGWFFHRKSRRVVREDGEYVWLHARHATEELPLLFNSEATSESRKNQLSRLVSLLRDAKLIETVKVGRDLYVRPSTLACEISSSRETVTKSPPIITPKHDDSITSGRDDSQSAIYNETSTSKTTRYPHSPPGGDCANGPDSGTPESEIYDAYPRKVGRPNALRAIRRAIHRHGASTVLERTRLFAQTYSGPAEFIPNPSTFFNQDRFLDDPATWQRAGSPPTLRQTLAPTRHYSPENYNQPVSNF